MDCVSAEMGIDNRITNEAGAGATSLAHDVHVKGVTSHDILLPHFDGLNANSAEGGGATSYEKPSKASTAEGGLSPAIACPQVPVVAEVEVATKKGRLHGKTVPASDMRGARRDPGVGEVE